MEIQQLTNNNNNFLTSSSSILTTNNNNKSSFINKPRNNNTLQQQSDIYNNQNVNNSLIGDINGLNGSSYDNCMIVDQQQDTIMMMNHDGNDGTTTIDLDDCCSVRVALRIRPQMARERIEMCKVCTYVTPNEPQVTLGSDKSFTFDYVFDIKSTQDELFDNCVKQLVDGCLNGYNATVLAYGQTGSGKTYTMGTSFDINLLPEEDGIIPRAVSYLFKQIENKKNSSISPDIQVFAQFMELYNEEIIDLFDTYNHSSHNNNHNNNSNNQTDINNNNNNNNSTTTISYNRSKSAKIEIHEDGHGNVYVNGCTMRTVNSANDTLELLKTGARVRTTASTNMNLQSSRSHAIFTIHIKQQRVIYNSNNINNTDSSDSNGENNEFETLSAKFHFVDLAGSERLKRTGAIGERAKEGICINRGLLALGNVISALGDMEKKGSHVPYRDSKLTRLLQDSLGGNSRTVMIACVSPSDSDFMETLNTLRYANRARNIKNKVIINQDKTSKQIALLRSEIHQLQLELMEYKSGKKIANNLMNNIGGGSIDNVILMDNGSTISVSELKQENYLIKSENNSLRIRCKAMQETIDNIREKNVKLLADIEYMKFNSINNNNNNKDVNGQSMNNNNTNNSFDAVVVKRYLNEIEELRCKLIETECTCQQLRNSVPLFNSKQQFFTSSSIIKKQESINPIAESYDNANDLESKQETIQLLLEEARKDIEKQKTILSTKTINNNNSSQETIIIERARSASSIESISTLNSIQLDNNSAGTSVQKCEQQELQENLTNLSVEIDMKERLIKELESQKKNFDNMKTHYEEKLYALNDRIQRIQEERDKIISNMTKMNQDNKYDEQIRKIKLDYEVKLKNLQTEITKYSNLKEKHTKILKTHCENEKQMQQLSKELIEMKKLKVKLINQLKDESHKFRMDEQKRMREIDALKRAQLKKDSQIKLLNEENKRKTVILKRKQEQLQALSARARSRPTNDKVTYRMTTSLIVNNNHTTTYSHYANSTFNQKLLQNKYQNIENSIQSIITKKQTISLIERDMERYLEQREKIGRKLNRFTKRLDKALANPTQEKSKVDELKEQIDIMKSNIDYIQDQISECQANIIELDESKDANDIITTQTLISSISNIEEAKYFLEKFLQMALNKGIIAAQKEYLNKELEVELSQFERDHYVQQQLLQQLMNGDSSDNGVNNGDYEIDEIILAPQIQESSDDDSDDSTRSNSPVRKTGMSKINSGTTILRTSTDVNNDETIAEEEEDCNSINDQQQAEKTRTKPINGFEDLLFGSSNTTKSSITSSINTSTNNTTITSTNTSLNEDLSKTKLLSTSYTKLAPNSKNTPIIDSTESNNKTNTPTNTNNNTTSNSDSNGVNVQRSASRHRSMSRHESKESLLSISPNGSPSSYRRQTSARDDNVFNRLTSETKQSPLPERGNVKSYTGSTTRFRNSPIICSHIAEGHSKAVLCVDAFDYKLFTSSKDRTAKVWDLHLGQEILSLNGHPNNVTKIKYCPHTNLVFTVSSSYVKVWDIRESPSTCIKTLSSSGLVIDGDFGIYRSNRTLQNELPTGEHHINDIVLDKYGNKLYTAAGNSVKIWDLKQFLPIGKLSGGHNSSIMTLAIDDVDFDNNVVITGSKDHYIKIYDVNDGIGVISPKRSLTPPHYDGVQALAIAGDTLFSGSRDMCIKKWDLVDYNCKQSINNAHKDWICALDYITDINVLISGCRGGYLKFWNSETCEKIADFRAHLFPINSIKIENNFVFTASDDSTVRIWKRSPNY